MIVLDTNILSEPSALRPSPVVMNWLNAQRPETLFLATPVIAELAAGAFDFERRTGSQRYVGPLHPLIEEYSGRILDFRVSDALLFGDIVARRNGLGRPILPLDAMIAAICLVHGATLATRNVRDFDGLDLKLLNPFEAAA